MNVIFSKKSSNYSKDNIRYILQQASQFDNELYSVFNNPNYEILVMGDIHRSQYISENVYNNYWFTIRINTKNIKAIPILSSIHIYVCFRLMDRFNNLLDCINPPSHNDIADISKLYGYWEYVGITKDSYKKVPSVSVLKTATKKRERKPLEIIDPTTGKQVLAEGINKEMKLNKKRRREKKINRNYIMKLNKSRGDKRKNLRNKKHKSKMSKKVKSRMNKSTRVKGKLHKSKNEKKSRRNLKHKSKKSKNKSSSSKVLKGGVNNEPHIYDLQLVVDYNNVNSRDRFENVLIEMVTSLPEDRLSLLVHNDIKIKDDEENKLAFYKILYVDMNDINENAFEDLLRDIMDNVNQNETLNKSTENKSVPMWKLKKIQ